MNFIVLIITLLFAGCSSTSDLKVTPIPNTSSLEEQLQIMSDDLAFARQSDIHILSPNFFISAEESFLAAKNDKDLSREKKFDKLGYAHASLDKAKSVANTARTELSTTIKSRVDTYRVGATLKDSEVSEAESNFRELVVDIEKGDLKDAKEDAPEVERQFRAIELRLIKNKYLAQINSIMTKAKKLSEQNDNITRTSISATQKEIKLLEQYIQKHRYDDNNIAIIGSKVQFLARRTLNITKQSIQIKNDGPQKTALRIEKLLVRLRNSTQSVLKDSRDMTFEQQAFEVEKFIHAVLKLGKNITQQRSHLTDKVEDLKTTVADTQQLKEQKEVEVSVLQMRQKLVNDVRAKFLSTEADVYLQDDNLIIRLVGVGFRIGKDTINENSLPVLQKLSSVLTELGKRKITVEGHSDSTGPLEFNDALSLARANSIRDYLINEQVTADDLIEAVGYGPSRPIDTNDTPAGRAKNRRIDLMISLTPASTM